MAFESCVLPESWNSTIIAPMYKGKRERTKCCNYSGISLLSIVGKTDSGILVGKVRNERLTDDGQGGFRAGKGCVDQIL